MDMIAIQPGGVPSRNSSQPEPTLPNGQTIVIEKREKGEDFVRDNQGRLLKSLRWIRRKMAYKYQEKRRSPATSEVSRQKAFTAIHRPKHQHVAAREASLRRTGQGR